MRRASLIALAILVLAPYASTASPVSRGVISCSNSSMDSLPSNWTIPDQSCIRVDLGELQQGESIAFQISSDNDVDILLFSASTVSIYQSEQTYRIDSVWQSESVFESFSGSGEWHWSVPSDRETTRWYLVIDNLAHPSDAGHGSQGGQASEASLEAGIITPEPFTLSDSIHRVEADSFSVAAGPFSVDEGTQMRIQARTMQGFPDIFVMNEDAFSLYSPSENWSSSSRIVSADMLLVTTERTNLWEVSGIGDEDLYVVVDNRAGPGGGGAGTSHAAVTVTVTLTPILNPIISSETNLESVDVGAQVSLSALDTPNKSEQIEGSSFSWDIDDDGVSDASGYSVTHVWDSPGIYPVRLWATSTDSRSASSTIEVSVIDQSDPVVSIGGGETIVKGYGEVLEISGWFSDNWGVDRVDWLLDGNIIESNYSIQTGVDEDASSSINIEVIDDFSPGVHIVSLLVTDKSGRSSQDDLEVSFVDITPPEILLQLVDSLPYDSQAEATVGDPVIFQISAIDNQSSSISYTWIIEQGTENEIEFIGPQVIHVFSTEGPQNVYCRVENEAGLTTFAEILVVVEGEETGGGLGALGLAIIAVFVIGIIAVGGFIAFNLAVRRKMSDIVEQEEENEEEAQTTEKPPEDVGMWGQRTTNPFQPSYEPQVRTPVEIDINDLIDETQISEPTMGTSEVDELQSEIANLDLETNIEKASDDDSRKVRKDCSSCSDRFELELPPGIDSAYTNCPHCGSEELVGL